MEKSTRRSFLRRLGAGLLVAAMAPVAATSALLRKRPFLTVSSRAVGAWANWRAIALTSDGTSYMLYVDGEVVKEGKVESGATDISIWAPEQPTEVRFS